MNPFVKKFSDVVCEIDVDDGRAAEPDFLGFLEEFQRSSKNVPILRVFLRVLFEEFESAVAARLAEFVLEEFYDFRVGKRIWGLTEPFANQQNKRKPQLLNSFGRGRLHFVERAV